ncbi:SusC/RagA family TonB-linked outer membrane protein [Parapedobacter deserti]|uniref:SusC/RagA family TonB-linked outer membrane protein n=1 Tax=Parapedobacter deserti TaxID=1912957 RepID=A0ABV7JII9_9SPHI
MKLTLILLLFFVQVSVAGLAQEVTLKVSNMPVKDVFHQLTLKTGYNFIAGSEVMNSLGNVTLNVNNQPLMAVLDKIFDPGTVDILLGGNKTIVIKMRAGSVDSKRASMPAALEQQERDVRGTVRDSTGEALPGVTVTAVGTSNVGTYTDANGRFVLALPNEVTHIEFSMIGFATVNEQVVGRDVIDIVLMESDAQIDEVVVVGFGTQKKVSVTGAISDVPVANIQRIATPSLSNALAGSMPGIITRQSSGEPGYDGAAVFIRGFGTWENRSPLILVDGVERDINSLNTQEIESFSILKDASATAVYGVRGANGVVLITTKRGKVGKPRVIFRTENATLQALRLPDYIDGYEYAGLINEALTNEGRAELYSSSDLEKFRDGSDPYLYPNVDWVNTVLKRNTFQTINNLSVTGGTDMVQYYTNVGYTVLNGIYKQDPDNFWNNNAQMKRYNFRSNVDIKLSKNLSLDLGIGGIIQRGNYPGRSAPDIFNSLRITSPINFPITNPDGSVAGGQTSYLQENPYGLVARSGYSTQDRNTLQGTFGGRLDLSEWVTEGLSLRGLFSYDHHYHGWNNRIKPYAIRQYLGKDANGEDQYRDPDIREEGSMGYGVGNTANRAYYSEAAINYARSFDQHNVAGMFLYNRRDYTDITAGSSLYNLPYRRQGIAGRVTYDFMSRYLFEANVGYNGSENFPEGKRYGFFPSVSAGWVISNEPFWNVSKVNNLKIRGSFGQVGNDQIGGTRFLFLTNIIHGGQDYPFGEQQTWMPGYNEDQIGNPDVTWEVATKANIGIDLEMFNGRAVLQVDAFRENREGILIQRGVIPRVAGYYPWVIPFANLGAAKNHGIDALLEIKNTTRSGFYYNFRGTVTYAKSTRVKDDLPTYLYPYQNPIGHLIDQPFGYISLGLFKDEDEIASSPRQTFMEDVRPGDIKYMDVNGDGVIDVFDRVAIGYPRTPQLVYGANFSVAYKGVELSAFFTGAARASLFIDGASMYPFQMGLGTYNIMRAYYDNRWTPETPDAKYPRVSTMDNPNNNRTSTHFLQDASYIRLKSAEVAYNFEVKALAKYGLERCRLFVNGVNLFTWDKIKIIDPESNYGTGGYPLQRSVNFGGQFTF